MTRTIRAGSTQRVFLGATRGTLTAIRRAMLSRSRLNVVVLASNGGRTARRDLQLTR